MIQDVADEVDRPAEHRLGAVSALRGVDAAVVHDPHVVNSAVGLHEVVIEHVHVIVVDVDRRGPLVGILRRRPVGRDADRVVEIGDRVVGDHMPRPVDLDRVVAREQVRAVGPALAHSGPVQPISRKRSSRPRNRLSAM